MALLASHLEQIELCASTISELPFPKPGIFTNALLNPPDITALIRDPDVHESALFSVVSAQELGKSNGSKDASLRGSSIEQSVALGTASNPFSAPKRHTAVAAVLGTDLAERLRRQRMGDTPWVRRRTGLPKDEVDIELLLRGAEKLCKAYPLQGVSDRIAALRARHEKVAASIAHYEQLTAEQSEQLSKLSRSSRFTASELEEDDNDTSRGSFVQTQRLTEDDVKREEDMVKELERRKRVLEERVDGMKKDIGGILR